ncbi:MAG: AI-2E family transporter [Dysgonamonadaceae bacterium]|jgi:predicted PurR-regulated permease PerM|nr:AI-2E family transporter [Dysgonamonadaceae bacterium]
MAEFKGISKKINYKYVLVGLLIVLGLIIFKYTRIYLSGFLGAATLYVILNGWQKYLTKKLNWSRSISALLLVLVSLIFFLAPLTGLTFMVIDTISGISFDPETIRMQIGDFITTLEERLEFEIVTTQTLTILSGVGTNVLQALGNSIISFIINIIVILFVLYYMLYNNDGFEKAIKEVLPFNEENKQILAEETRLIIQANAIGIPAMAFIQGLFAYFGYLFFGIDSPLLYAILTAFSTIIPIIGTMIVWIPIGVGMLMGGDYMGGFMMLLYGFFIIGGVDNVARFILQKRLADIHPLITVFGVLIGIPMFGFWGVIFGPLVLSLFVLFINMYRHEYVPGSTAEPRIATRYKGEQQVKMLRNLFMKKKRKIPD